MRRIIIILSITAIMAGCKQNLETIDKDVVVRVHNKNLYKSDVANIVPKGFSESDSIDLADKYIRKWITHELLTQKARFNVGDEDPEIDQMVLEYRNALVIKKYKEQILEQKAAIDPSPEEIKTFYENNVANYPLQEELIQGLIVKLPLDAPKLKDLRSWLNSNEEDDFREVEGYCYQHATMFDDFRDKWVTLQMIQSLLPDPIKNKRNVLRGKGFEEQRDSLFNYFLKVSQYKEKNDTAPLQYVEQNIVTLLRHQKKLQFFRDLEKDIYNEGLKDETVIYNPIYE